VLEALSNGVLNTIYGLLGRDQVEDPLGASAKSEPNLGDLMTAVRVLHLI
jgi:hypothetical protein